MVNLSSPAKFDWDFGDGSAHATNQFATHAYSTTGSYPWRVISRVTSGANSASVTNSGVIQITGKMLVRSQTLGGGLTLSWPVNAGDVVLEASPSLGGSAHWQPVPGGPPGSDGSFSFNVDPTASAKFFRLRQVK